MLLRTLHRLASPLHIKPSTLRVIRNSNQYLHKMQVLSETGRENVPQQPFKIQKIDPMDSLRVKRLTETAILPKRGSAKAAGYDIAASEDTIIPAKGKGIVKTGLSIAIPPQTYARIAPRSGLAVKNFIDTGAGVVDEDYRGEVGVVLFNHSDTDFKVVRGDRVAQLILERITTPDVVEVDDLDETDRGAGGYGSTGVATK